MPHDVDHNAILGRLAATRGGIRNVFEGLDPARTAHVIIDMQNGFVEQGAPVEVPMARTISGAINRVSAAIRASGGRNYFVQYTTPDDVDQGWSIMMERLGGLSDAHREGFRRGAHYWELWPELEVEPEDALVEKGRFSAFTHGTSTLEDRLKAQGADTIVVSGTVTNICCESTARDAMQHNYRVIIATDGNAALSDDEHAAALTSLAFAFADLRSSEEIEALLAG
ncbi:MAG TPA: cysteine hydrolase [Sphingomonadaceae bacterium]|nr:cysteine hydrolase [Sphingomonadaceae bacterium]